MVNVLVIFVEKLGEDMENESVISRERLFTERSMLPGELAEVKDKHTLAFCFGDGDIAYLNFDESVSEGTAKELIEKIKQFAERNWIDKDRRMV